MTWSVESVWESMAGNWLFVSFADVARYYEYTIVENQLHLQEFGDVPPRMFVKAGQDAISQENLGGSGLLIAGVPIEQFSGYTSDDVRAILGEPSFEFDLGFDGITQFSYDVGSFDFDAYGELINISPSLWNNSITTSYGASLRMSKSGLVALFGDPTREGFEAEAGPPYVVAFGLESNILIEFWMNGPEDYFEAQLIWIWFD